MKSKPLMITEEVLATDGEQGDEVEQVTVETPFVGHLLQQQLERDRMRCAHNAYGNHGTCKL